MKLLLFSDIHSDLRTATRLVDLSHDVDIVVGAGDYCIARRGLPEIITLLAKIQKPTVLVAGNSESAEELTAACASWRNGHVLHGTQLSIGAVSFFGIGGGIPVTPFGSWSYDFSEDEARHLLRDCPGGGVLISHSPPKGILDRSSGGMSLGSKAVREVIQDRTPDLVACGHIHGSSGKIDRLGDTTVINAGPRGIVWEMRAGL